MTYRPPARRKSKAPRRILITLIVFVLLLVAADRVGDLVAENVAADKLQQSQKLPNKPDVDINGFPFLTQFASGEYDQVEVNTGSIRLGNDTIGLDLADLDVTLDDVSITDNFDQYHVDHLSAVATADYRALSEALNTTVSYSGQGRISLKLPVIGEITLRPELTGNALRFAGSSANGLSDLLNSLGRIGIPLEGLPFDLKVTKLQLTAAGLRLDLAGADLNYRR